MIDNNNTLPRDESEPLEAVLRRAYSGRTISEGYGPFFICEHGRNRRLRVCPFAFASVEEAAAYLYECVPPERLPADSRFTICLRLSSAWVQ